MRPGRVALLLSLAAALAVAEPAPVRYPPVVPDVALEFPRDEGAHPAFRIEWWYVTGWLRDAGSEPTGFQVTFFRVRPGLAESNPSRFAPTQVLFGHAAIAEPAFGRLRHAERSARAGFDLAYAREGSVDVRLDDWSLRQDGARYRATVRGEDFALRLDLVPGQPPLLQGEGGFSRKGPDPLAASYYYSMPQLAVDGEVTIAGRERRVTGEAWLDHEWSSDYVDPAAVGWDWMGINLEDGGALMAFRMRDGSGGERWAGATLRSADGRVRTYSPEEIEWLPERRWESTRTGVTYPVAWRVTVGDRTYRVRPVLDDAELDSRSSTGTIYWEGPVRLLDETDRLVGRGYLELTGYAAKMEI